MQEQLLGWLASAQRLSGDLAGAEVTTERLVRRYPADVRGLIDLSVYSLRRGDRATAEAYLTRALAVDPSNQDAQRRLAAIRAQAQ
jgi:Tfp pilus assembly protein PilF